MYSLFSISFNPSNLRLNTKEAPLRDYNLNKESQENIKEMDY